MTAWDSVTWRSVDVELWHWSSASAAGVISTGRSASPTGSVADRAGRVCFKGTAITNVTSYCHSICLLCSMDDLVGSSF